MIAKLPYVGLLLGLVALPGCNPPAAKPPCLRNAPRRGGSLPAIQSPVSINAEMVRVVDHAAHELWNVEREGMAPKTDGDWDNVVEHATQLAAAGALIRLEGTGPNDRTFVQQPEWQKFADNVSSAGLSAVHAAEAKDLQALVTVNGQLVEACEGCHKQYKPAIPSEGIMHTQRWVRLRPAVARVSPRLPPDRARRRRAPGATPPDRIFDAGNPAINEE